VTSRANGPAAIFSSDADRGRFLSQLADNVTKTQQEMAALTRLSPVFLSCFRSFALS
jgi:hypothetical protein